MKTCKRVITLTNIFKLIRVDKNISDKYTCDINEFYADREFLYNDCWLQKFCTNYWKTLAPWKFDWKNDLWLEKDCKKYSFLI